MKKKTTLMDPVANAKTIGFLYLLAGGINILSFITGERLPLFLPIDISTVAVGFLLRKQMLWGLYGLLALIPISLITVVYAQGSIVTSLIGNAITLGLFMWFYRSKALFGK